MWIGTAKKTSKHTNAGQRAGNHLADGSVVQSGLNIRFGQFEYELGNATPWSQRSLQLVQLQHFNTVLVTIWSGCCLVVACVFVS